MNVIYPAILHKEDGAYWVEFPDLVGCQSFGDTLTETVENAKEALAGYCLTMIEQRMKLPVPSELDAIDSEGGTIAVIEANLSEAEKSVKKTLTIPAWLNRAAEEAHVNFSQVLREGLQRQLNL